MLTISQLYIYPVKSLGGIAMQQATVTDRGFEYDRRWMLVDTGNRFISQREFPEMCLFKPAITPQGLQVIHQASASALLIPFKPSSLQLLPVKVWDDVCLAQPVSKEADDWFTNLLGLPCRLVYMPDDSRRQVDRKYAPEGLITSFADGFPFMMISEESLNDLNARMGNAIPMNRFRPSIVFTGGEAYAEDELAAFTIGEIDFCGVKLCVRCNIPGIDQDTAKSYKEPAKTLAAYRRLGNNIYFGQNLIHNGTGIIKIGDALKIKSVKSAVIFN